MSSDVEMDDTILKHHICKRSYFCVSTVVLMKWRKK